MYDHILSILSYLSIRLYIEHTQSNILTFIYRNTQAGPSTHFGQACLGFLPPRQCLNVKHKPVPNKSLHTEMSRAQDSMSLQRLLTQSQNLTHHMSWAAWRKQNTNLAESPQRIQQADGLLMVRVIDLIRIFLRNMCPLNCHHQGAIDAAYDVATEGIAGE